MKIFLLVVAAVAAAAPLAQAQTAYRTVPATSAPTTVARPSANPNFRLVQQQTQTFNAGAWADSVRLTYSRFTATNEAQRRLTERGSPRANRPLAPVLRNHYTFGAGQRLLVDTAYTFSTTTGAANPRYFTRYTYTAQGKLAQRISAFRFQTNYDPFSRYSYSYDALGRLTRVLEEVADGPVNYLNDAQTTYTYPGTSLLDSEEELQLWNPAANAFEPAERYLKTYTPTGNLLAEVAQSSPNGSSAYQNTRRETYTYNTTIAGRIESTAVDFWRNGAWQPAGLNTFSYDTDDNLTQLLTRTYTSPTTFANFLRNLYTYQRILAATPAHTLNAGLVALPNPATAGTAAALRYELPTAAPVAATVFDAAGRAVATVPAAAQAAGPHTLALPAIATPGLYLVRLSAGTQSQTVRIAVE